MKLNEIFKGVAQMGGVGFLVKLLTIVQTIILMRLLDPYDFGIIAIGITFILILSRFQTIGISEALIADKDNINKSDSFSTLFWLRFLLSFFLFILALFVAPYWASFYDDDNITKVVRLLSLSLIIKSFAVVPKTSLMIELNFSKLAQVNMMQNIAGTLSVILLVFQGYGYFSIVFGFLIGAITEALLFLYHRPWIPKFELDYSMAKKYLSYGKWLFLTSIFYSILSSYDAFLIGKYLSLVDLGFYSVALRWSYLTLLHITPYFQKVLFSVFSASKEQSDIKSDYLKSNFAIALVSFPVTAGIIFIAEDLLFLISGEKWLDVTTPLRILAICGLIRSFVIADPIFGSENRPQYSTYTVALSLTFIIIFLYLAILWKGLIGVSICLTITYFFHYIYCHYFLNKILSIEIRAICNELVKPFLSSLIMLLVLFLIRAKLYSIINNDFLSLLGVIIIGIVVYFVAIYYTSRQEIIERLYIS